MPAVKIGNTSLKICGDDAMNKFRMILLMVVSRKSKFRGDNEKFY